MAYTTKRITRDSFNESDLKFIAESANKANAMYGERYDWIAKWTPEQFWTFIDKNFLMICYRDENPVGFIAASFYSSFFDFKVILRQNLLFAIPGTRAAYILLKEFIDFGRNNANHVITMIAQETNVKPRSLERMGFKKLEELYFLEA